MMGFIDTPNTPSSGAAVVPIDEFYRLGIHTRSAISFGIIELCDDMELTDGWVRAKSFLLCLKIKRALEGSNADHVDGNRFNQKFEGLFGCKRHRQRRNGIGIFAMEGDRDGDGSKDRISDGKEQKPDFIFPRMFFIAR